MSAINIISRYARRTPDLHDSFRDLGLDCIDRMTIAMHIEEDYNCELRDSTVEAWHSVACVAETIEGLAWQDVGDRASKASAILMES